jgi:hypothetical protein
VKNRTWAGAFLVLATALILVLSIPCAAGQGGRSDGTGAPVCTITSPANGSLVRGSFDVCVTAIKGALPLDAVQVRVDAGPWRYAAGLEDLAISNWTISIDISLLKDGNHTVTARALDANMSSAETSLTISVRNPGPAASSRTDLVCLVFVIIVAGTTASIVLGAVARRMI